MEFVSFLCSWVSSRVYSSTFHLIYLTFSHSCVSIEIWSFGWVFSFLELPGNKKHHPLPSISPWPQKQAVNLGLAVIPCVTGHTSLNKNVFAKWAVAWLIYFLEYHNGWLSWFFIACLFYIKRHQIFATLKNLKNILSFGFLCLGGGGCCS